MKIFLFMILWLLLSYVYWVFAGMFPQISGVITILICGWFIYSIFARVAADKHIWEKQKKLEKGGSND